MVEEKKSMSDQLASALRKVQTLEAENVRLKEENDRLRDELGFLRHEVGGRGMCLLKVPATHLLSNGGHGCVTPCAWQLCVRHAHVALSVVRSCACLCVANGSALFLCCVRTAAHRAKGAERLLPDAGRERRGPAAREAAQGAQGCRSEGCAGQGEGQLSPTRRETTGAGSRGHVGRPAAR